MDERTVVRRLCFKPVWPTAPRDFLCCTTWKQFPNGSILICTRSAPECVLPPQKGYVRGSIRISGYLIEPMECLLESDRESKSGSESKSGGGSGSRSQSRRDSGSGTGREKDGGRESDSQYLHSTHKGDSQYLQSQSQSQLQLQNGSGGEVRSGSECKGCRVTLTAHTDLGGSLPPTVINMLSTAAPLKMMAAIADIVARK